MFTYETIGLVFANMGCELHLKCAYLIHPGIDKIVPGSARSQTCHAELGGLEFQVNLLQQTRHFAFVVSLVPAHVKIPFLT
jgi:hypothetical protein